MDRPSTPLNQKLPDDILYHVISILNPSDQFHWLLSCRHAYNIFQLLMYERIDCTPISRPKAGTLVWTLTKRPDLAANIRSLVLSDQGPEVNYPRGEWDDWTGPARIREYVLISQKVPADGTRV
jgi:hypothetical protein